MSGPISGSVFLLLLGPKCFLQNFGGQDTLGVFKRCWDGRVPGGEWDRKKELLSNGIITAWADRGDGHIPLVDNAEALLRTNLEKIGKGERVSPVIVGKLTPAQLAAINKYKKKVGLPPISDEVVFIGSHVHKSRIQKDGYSIDDVIAQIVSAFDPASTAINGGKMTAIRNPTKRNDGYGNQVRDEVIFECLARYPMPELFSVVPRGDTKKPPKTEEAASLLAASPVQKT